METHIITPFDAPRVAEWYSKAFNTPDVSRFLGFSMTREAPPAVDPDWVNMFIVDSCGHGLAKLSPARSYNNQYCDLSVWVLPSAGATKKFIAGALLQRAFHEARTRFGCRYMEWGVSGSNVESLAFSRRRAQQWAFKTEGAWDPLLCAWVDMYCFRLDLEAFFSGTKRNAED